MSRPMAGARRRVRNPLGWVQMYRCVLPAARIAALVGAAEITVSDYLQLAVRSDPSIRDEHLKAGTGSGGKFEDAALRNLEDIVALYRVEGRLPSGNSTSARERALRSWLSKRRREAEAGTLSPRYWDRLREIPGWDAPSKQRDDFEALWNERLTELIRYWGARHDWPSDNAACNDGERALGVWLRNQRSNHRHGRLRPKLGSATRRVPAWLACELISSGEALSHRCSPTARTR